MGLNAYDPGIKRRGRYFLILPPPLYLLGEMKIPVVFNYTGKPKSKDETIPYLLQMQVQSCIYLEKSIRFLESVGVDTIVDIGPKNVNSRLAERISKKIQTFSVSDLQGLRGVLEILCK